MTWVDGVLLLVMVLSAILAFLRGFVREIAKLLRLDPAQVDRTYLRRLREGLEALGRGPA